MCVIPSTRLCLPAENRRGPRRRTPRTPRRRVDGFLTGLFLWLFRFAYLKATEKAINSNLNNFHAQNYVCGLPADNSGGRRGPGLGRGGSVILSRRPAGTLLNHVRGGAGPARSGPNGHGTAQHALASLGVLAERGGPQRVTPLQRKLNAEPRMPAGGVRPGRGLLGFFKMIYTERGAARVATETQLGRRSSIHRPWLSLPDPPPPEREKV